MLATPSATKVFSAKKIFVGGAVLALAAGITGCTVEDFKKATSDVWAVTYEVSVSGGETGNITDITYLNSEQRGEASTEQSLASANTKASGKGAAVWTLDSNVTAEKDAAVSAVPGKGSTATCRILLDGVKEIAVATSKPGERVDCAATTPAFSK